MKLLSARSYIKYGLSAGLHYSGANRIALMLRGMRECVIVLAYHRVLSPENPMHSRTERALVTSTASFIRQMELISERFNPIALSDLIRWLDGESSVPSKAILVTFDDGWLDTYTNAYPIMRRLAIPGVVFLSTGFIGTSRQYWTERVYSVLEHKLGADAAHVEMVRIKGLPADERREIIESISEPSDIAPNQNLTWEQVREMAAQGFEFGSHTREHIILPHELGTHVLKELGTSAVDIEARLGHRPLALAYPDGQYDDTCRRLAAVAHYRCAFTCEEGVCTGYSHPLALPRLNIHDGVCKRPDGKFSKAMFFTYLCGTIPWLHTRRRS